MGVDILRGFLRGDLNLELQRVLSRRSEAKTGSIDGRDIEKKNVRKHVNTWTAYLDSDRHIV